MPRVSKILLRKLNVASEADNSSRLTTALWAFYLELSEGVSLDKSNIIFKIFIPILIKALLESKR